MTEKRFFILTDDEYNTRPCIRDRKREIHDIYGDYKYDDLNEICNTLNKLFDSNNSLKESLLLHLDIIDGLNDKIKELKQQVDNICREINDKPTMTTTEVMVKLQELIY